MRRYVANAEGKVVDYEDAEPICSEDFCDSCGDCLVCYSEENCRGLEGGLPKQHIWVRYVS